MPAFRTRFAIGGAAALAALTASHAADAAVVSTMTTPPGATATVRVIITVGTALGTSSDDDVETVALTGSGNAAFLPNAPPFTSAQLNDLQFNFATATFNFQLFCIGPFCQQLNVTVSNLQFDLVQATCSNIAAGTGAVSFSNSVFHSTGNYSTTGLATSSGRIDGTAAAAFSGRITNPSPGTVRLDQLAIANQTFVVPPDQLPTGVNSLSFTVETNLANILLNGPFNAAPQSFDADGDAILDACDSCTDLDGDGAGDAGFPANTCPIDNCPSIANPLQGDRDLDGTGDLCDCLADIAPSAGGGDNSVGVADLLAVISAWGACPAPGSCLPDIAPVARETIGDGAVGVADLLAVISNWGACP